MEIGKQFVQRKMKKNLEINYGRINLFTSLNLWLVPVARIFLKDDGLN